jgi:hypothetical protein
LRAGYVERVWRRAPIGRLPVELIAKILYYLVGFTPGSFLDDRFVKIILLTCKQWNQIAHSTPEIWSLIDIDVQGNCETFEKIWTEKRLATWVKRANKRPLDLRVSNVPNKEELQIHDGYHDDWVDCERIMPVASRYQEWRSLEVTGDQALRYTMSPFIAVSHYGHNPFLPPEETTHPLFPAGLKAPAGFHYVFPALESLSISSVTDYIVFPFPLMWAEKLSILVLYLVEIYEHDYRRLAASTSNVRSLSFRKVSWEVEEDKDVEYCHSQLQSLTFHTSDYNRQYQLSESLMHLVKPKSRLQKLNIYSQSKRDEYEECLWKDVAVMPNAIEAIRSPISSVTFLDLHMGDLPSPAYSDSDVAIGVFTQFLSAFIRVEDLTLRWDPLHPWLLRPATKSNLLLLWTFSSSLMSAIISLNHCRHVSFRSSDLPCSQLLYLAARFQDRIYERNRSENPLRLTLDSSCAVWEDALSDSLLQAIDASSVQQSWADMLHQLDRSFDHQYMKAGDGLLLKVFEPPSLTDRIRQVAPNIVYEVVVVDKGRDAHGETSDEWF